MKKALNDCKCQTYPDFAAYMLSQGLDELGNTLIVRDPAAGLDGSKPSFNLSVDFAVHAAGEKEPFEKTIGWKDPRFELDVPVPQHEYVGTLNARVACLPGQPPPLKGEVCGD
jgi:hypothetical protein